MTLLAVTEQPDGSNAPEFVDRRLPGRDAPRSRATTKRPTPRSRRVGSAQASRTSRESASGLRRCRSRSTARRGGSPSSRSPLDDVDDNVALIRRQILIAGAIAIAAAALSASGRREPSRGACAGLRFAAEHVAQGDFSQPIPIESRDELGQLARVVQRDAAKTRAPRQRAQGVHRQRLARAAHADLLARRVRRAARDRQPEPVRARASSWPRCAARSSVSRS